jgi:tRNA G18 (ribose-2'-O)-methylase SpoU
MAVTRLDDQNADLLADYRNVPDPELMSRRGLFVAEGRLIVTRLLANRRFATRSVLLTETAYAALRDAIDGRPDVPAYVVSQRVINDITGFNIHRGCLALGERPRSRDWRDLARDATALVVLERVGNADNVGALFRNSAAFGVDGVLLGPSCADPLYRKAIRTSMGAALALPFATIDEWPDAVPELNDGGWLTIALTPDATALPLRDLAVDARGRRCALVLGHEGEGLTPAALAATLRRARIPMAADVDSLNVATAAAVALYELTSVTRT